MAIWKIIKDYPSYMVSDHGEIKSLNYNGTKKEKILTPFPNKKGYLCISLYKDCKIKPSLVHRIVAEAFIPNFDNKPQVNHIDGNKQNNAVNNLEWCNNSENTLHAYKIGLNQNKRSVSQYDKNNNFIKDWYSLSEAANCLKIDVSHIQQVCVNKRRSAGGYKWRYKEAV